MQIEEKEKEKERERERERSLRADWCIAVAG